MVFGHKGNSWCWMDMYGIRRYTDKSANNNGVIRFNNEVKSILSFSHLLRYISYDYKSFYDHKITELILISAITFSLDSAFEMNFRKLRLSFQFSFIAVPIYQLTQTKRLSRSKVLVKLS